MKTVYTLLAALTFGFIGGVIGTRFNLERHRGDAIRATQFELVDESGFPVASWGKDNEGNVVLAFKSATSQNATSIMKGSSSQILALGVLANGHPALGFYGKDGQSRVKLYLTEYEKPTLSMEDDGDMRISLGIDPSDAPSITDNDWSLTFHPSRASIGMFADQKTRKRVKGYMHVNSQEFELP